VTPAALATVSVDWTAVNPVGDSAYVTDPLTVRAMGVPLVVRVTTAGSPETTRTPSVLRS
jgi:hypothetical protein